MPNGSLEKWSRRGLCVRNWGWSMGGHRTRASLTPDAPRPSARTPRWPILPSAESAAVGAACSVWPRTRSCMPWPSWCATCGSSNPSNDEQPKRNGPDPSTRKEAAGDVIKARQRNQVRIRRPKFAAIRADNPPIRAPLRGASNDTASSTSSLTRAYDASPIRKGNNNMDLRDPRA
jgi:hypothetical protein